jgi:hypothetical protein
MKGMYGSSSIHSIHSLWYVEAQRDLSNQLKTSLLAPLPTYLMTEAFLTEFNSKKMKWFTEFIFCRPKGVLSP